MDRLRAGHVLSFHGFGKPRAAVQDQNGTFTPDGDLLPAWGKLQPDLVRVGGEDRRGKLLFEFGHRHAEQEGLCAEKMPHVNVIEKERNSPVCRNVDGLVRVRYIIDSKELRSRPLPPLPVVTLYPLSTAPLPISLYPPSH